MFTRGIRPHPADHDKVVAQKQQTTFWRNGEKVADPNEWKMSGSIFYDGSCFRHREPELSTASFAVVEVDENGEATAVLRATVSPELPQTSQAAEHSGRLAAVQMLHGPAVLHGDCKAVVDSANLPSWRACHHKRLHGGSRRAAEASQRNHWATDFKVKAHRKIESATTDAERWEIRGNAAADTNVVAAQLMHPLLSAEQRVLRQNDDNKLEQVCRVLGAVPRLWPKADRLQSVRPPGKKGKRRRREAVAPHEWHYRTNTWVCAVCFKRARTRQAILRRQREECDGLAQKMAAVVAHPRGHILAAADDDGGKPLLVCIKCGSWAESNPRALLKECKGCVVPGSEGSQALRRLASGKHPQHQRGHLVGPVVALQSEHQDAASQALNRFLQSAGRLKGRLAPDSGGGTRAGMQNLVVARADDVLEAQCPAPRRAPGRERLEALRARVAAKARV